MKYLFAIFFLFSFFTVSAQGILRWARYQNGTFQSITQLTTSDITSDYGMRNPHPTNGTRFHRGLDFVPVGNTNVVLVAHAQGTIERIVSPIIGQGNITQIRKIVINFGGERLAFLHIFQNLGFDQTYNGFRISTLHALGASNSIADEPVIIDLVNLRAFCRISNIQISVNNQVLVTRNTVQFDEPFAPMGDSGNGYPYHTHVSQLEYQSFDDVSCSDSVEPVPDAVRTQNSLVNFSIEVRRRNFSPIPLTGNCEERSSLGSWNSFIPSYDRQTRNIVEAKIEMLGATMGAGRSDRYSNSYMNDDQGGIRIKNKDCGGYQTIIGRVHNTKIITNPLGTIAIYPPEICSQQRYGGVEDHLTGIMPYAYTSGIGFHPHDFYLFPDFYHRIHKSHAQGTALSLAQHPWNARYQDGNYQMQGYVQPGPNASEVKSSEVDFTLDNFKPFIHQVKIFAYPLGDPLSSTKIYDRYWEEGTGNQIKLEPKKSKGTNFDPQLSVVTFEIVALESERLKNLSVEIPSLGISQPVSMTERDGPNPCIKEWVATVNAPFSQSLLTCHQLIFKGEDLNGNPVIKLNPPDCLLGGSTDRVPIRTAAGSPGTWLNDKPDRDDWTHNFRYFNDCVLKQGELASTDPNCTIFEGLNYLVTSLSSNGANDGKIIPLKHHLPLDIVDFVWTDANGVVISTNDRLIGLAPGIYCLSASYDCCKYEGCFEVFECNLEVTPSIMHPAYGQNNGSVTINLSGGSGDYTIEWSSGEEDVETIINKPAGDYCVTVTDQGGCSNTACVTLSECQSPPNIAQSMTLSQPTTCEEPYDGSIRLIGSPIVSGGIAPYTFHWENDKGEVITPNTTSTSIVDLAPGTYCYVAKDANGCRARVCATLLAPGQPVVIEDNTSLTPECSGLSNGTINITAVSPAGASGLFYDWLWDTGDVFSNVETVTISGLPSGTYCAQLTSLETGCVFEHCSSVGVANSSPLIVTQMVNHPCFEKNNGNITVNVTGGQQPYTYQWSKANAPNTNILNNVFEGSYSVTVTDYCGQSVVRVFELKSLRVKISAFPEVICNTATLLSAIHLNGVPPFSYKWSNGSTQSETTVNSRGLYQVTVTDFQGCTSVGIIDLKESSFSDITYGSGCGPNTSYITVNIQNPSGGLVKLYLNNTKEYEGGQGITVFPISLAGLPAINSATGKNRHLIRIEFEACTKEFEIELKETPITHRYSSYNASRDLCTYDTYCKDELIQANAYSQAPLLRFSDISEGPSQCWVGKYCGNERVGVQDFEKKTVRAAQYRQILLAAQATGLYNSDYIQIQLDLLVGENLGECTRVKYCTGTLKMISHWIGNDGTLTSNGSGCFTLDCGIFSHDYCLSEILPDHIVPTYVNGGPIIGELCTPIVYRISHLLSIYNDLLTHVPNFGSSSLRTFLDDVRNRAESNCANVSFCKENLNYIGSDINKISYCGSEVPGSPFKLCVPFTDESGRQYVWCECDGCIGNVGAYPLSVTFTPSAWEFFKPAEVRFNHEGSSSSITDECITVTPNPFSESFTLSLCKEMEASGFSLELYGILGEVLPISYSLLNAGKIQVNVAGSWPPGAYFIVLREKVSGRPMYYRTIIKN